MIVRKTRNKGTACGLQNINKSVMAEGRCQPQFKGAGWKNGHVISTDILESCHLLHEMLLCTEQRP